MVRLSPLLVLVLGVGLDLVYGHGHGHGLPPLHTISPATTLSLSILPRPNAPHDTTPTLRHSDTFRLILAAFTPNTHFHLHLRPNNDLLHPGVRINNEPLLRESVRIYEGHVIDAAYSEARMREDSARVVRRQGHVDGELGWARIMVHADQGAGGEPVYEGAFSVRGVVHHLVTRANYARQRGVLDIEPLDGEGLLIWRETDLEVGHGGAATCGHVDYGNNTSRLYRRDDVAGGSMDTNYIDNIGDDSGCPTDQKVVYMGVAADCEYVTAYGGKENATQQILNNWNSASSLYKSTFNVALGIVELQVQDSACPSTADTSTAWNIGCSDTLTLTDRLSLFSEWRAGRSDSAGLWHLMSGCPTGSEVGIAWLGVLCMQGRSGSDGSVVSGTGVSTNGRTEWQIVAHEIGHNFGAIHDCSEGCALSDNCCPLSTSVCNADSQFIMSPVSQASENTFSQCTIGNICSVLGGTGGDVNTTCLIDASSASTTISLQMCGNGIVEDGEDCDPGSNASSACCDSATCRFTTGAVCDPANSACCLDTCDYAPASTVCREAKDASCDTAETCTGTSADCPEDVFSPNGEDCGGGLACASGQCTSVSLQCQTVGASMGLEKACSKSVDNSCQVTCEDPENAGQCIQLNAVLVDGSPCGYGGTCDGGTCLSGGALNTALAWYRQNLQIAIPVTIVAGLIVLSILYYILRGIYRCASGKRRDVPGANPTYTSLRHERLDSYDRAIPTYLNGPQAGWVQQPRHNRAHWIDDQHYNGPR